MKEIPLTQGKVALVYDEDYERLSTVKWFAHKPIGSRTWYARRNVTVGVGKQAAELMHVAVIGTVPSGYRIDHEDGDGLNNVRNNLRLATHSQNMHNLKRIRLNSSSGFHGVSKRGGRWWVRIQANGNRVDLGVFENKEAGARAYDAAARKYFKEFARYNFPDEQPPYGTLPGETKPEAN